MSQVAPVDGTGSSVNRVVLTEAGGFYYRNYLLTNSDSSGYSMPVCRYCSSKYRRLLELYSWAHGRVRVRTDDVH